jgi:hypothetical protein
MRTQIHRASTVKRPLGETLSGTYLSKKKETEEKEQKMKQFGARDCTL